MEEPLHRADYAEGMRALREATDVRIAGGEMTVARWHELAGAHHRAAAWTCCNPMSRWWVA